MKRFFNYKILPITILLLHTLIFFYLRTLYLLEYPEDSYMYYKVSAHPHYMLLETVVVHTILLCVFIFGYFNTVSLFRSLPKREPITQKKAHTLCFEFLFFVAIGLSLYRSFILGEVAGQETSDTTKYLFFLHWIIPLNLVYTYLLLSNTSTLKKVFYTLLLIFSVMASGMKGGLIWPIVIIFFAYTYNNNNIKFKYFYYIFIGLVSLVFLFPFVFQIVEEIRHSGSVSIENFLSGVIYTFKHYEQLFQKITQYLYYRLSLVEYLQVMLQYYSNINRDEINILTLIVHIYNAFVPSFMEPKEWYLNFSGNKIHPILFFGMEKTAQSSEALTIPGFFVFYFGWFSPVFSLLFGAIFGYVYMKITRLKNRELSNLFSIYFLVMFFKVIQSFSIEHMALVVKECVSFTILYFVITMFTNSLLKRRKLESSSMA